MELDEQIREALRRMIKEISDGKTILGVVVSVDENDCVCVLKDDEDLQKNDIRLRVVLDGKKGVTQYPKVGTWCLAIAIEDSEDYLAIAFGELDKLNVKVGNSVLEITPNGHLIKKGDDTLKEAITLIVQAVQKIIVLQGTGPDYSKLAQALTKINNVLQ